jgi:hypothetical protein
MTNFIYNTEPDKKELSLREKQCNCPHTCWKCPLCGLYKDNIFNTQKIKIEVLEGIIDIYEQVLIKNNYPHIQNNQEVMSSIIDSMIDDLKRKYHKQD